MDKTKKVAIVSFHRADNYGAVLQNYALQQAICKLGRNVSTIDLCCEEIEHQYKNQIIPDIKVGLHKKLIYFVLNCINYKKTSKHRMSFQSFRIKNLFLSKKVDNLKEIQKDYDVFITGSDQVWNPNITGNDNIDNYVLHTVYDRKKSAYAASCGAITNLNALLIQKIAELDYITVRENTLALYLREFIDKDIKVVCDPVLLLDKEEWSQKLTNIKRRKYKYVFLYFNNNKEVCDVARYIKRERNIKLICPCKRNKFSLIDGYYCYENDPFEFLNDLLHAEIVVASSFHAIAFSILFEKEFVAVLNKYADSRVRDLLTTLDLNDRIVSDINDYINKQAKFGKIDYSKTKSKLVEWRDNSLIELRKMC